MTKTACKTLRNYLLVARHLLLLTLALGICPTRTLADTGLVKEVVFNWLVDGVSPQPPTNPYCATDSGHLLGHITDSTPDTWIERPLAALCQAHVQSQTGELPVFVYACYTTVPVIDDFDDATSGDPLCFCDYYLCNSDHQQPFEEAVDLAVSIVEFFD